MFHVPLFSSQHGWKAAFNGVRLRLWYVVFVRTDCDRTVTDEKILHKAEPKKYSCFPFSWF